MSEPEKPALIIGASWFVPNAKFVPDTLHRANEQLRRDHEELKALLRKAGKRHGHMFAFGSKSVELRMSDAEHKRYLELSR